MGQRGRTSSPWRRWRPPWASSRTSSSRRRNLWRTCKSLSTSPYNSTNPPHIEIIPTHLIHTDKCCMLYSVHSYCTVYTRIQTNVAAYFHCQLHILIQVIAK